MKNSKSICIIICLLLILNTMIACKQVQTSKLSAVLPMETSTHKVEIITSPIFPLSSTSTKPQLPTPSSSLDQSEIPPGILAILTIGKIGENIVLMDTDGRNVKTLEEGIFLTSRISWSPDGRWIVFNGSFDFLPKTVNIYRVQIKGNQLIQINSDPHGGTDVTWSPDGHRILYSLINNDQSDLIISTIDGSNYYKLKYTEGYEASPRYSPDGKKIAYIYWQNDGDPTLWIMDSSGSSPKQLSNLAILDRETWSPDGKKIAFTAKYQQGSLCGEIYIVDISTNNFTKLDKLPYCVCNPQWSPDGSYLAFLKANNPDSKNAFEYGWQIYFYDLSKEILSTPGIFQDIKIVSFEWSPVAGLRIGSKYIVSFLGQGLGLHEDHKLSSKIIQNLEEGQSITIIDGPVLDEGLFWWKIVSKGRVEGWISDHLGWFLSP